MTGVMKMALMRGNYSTPENRRRRDSRGRYMEGEGGARGAYDNYMTYDEYTPPYASPESRRKMGFARYAMDEREMNDNDIRRRNTGREDGSFSEQGENYRYPTNRGGTNRMSMGGGGGRQMSGQVMQMRKMMQNMGGKNQVEPLDKETAEEWVSSMHNTDKRRPEGECWTMEEVKEIARKQGMKEEEEIIEFYAVLNAVWSDYYEVAQKYGHGEDEQFFIDLAMAWLEDEDAVEDKAAAYYKYIVKKE